MRKNEVRPLMESLFCIRERLFLVFFWLRTWKLELLYPLSLILSFLSSSFPYLLAFWLVHSLDFSLSVSLHLCIIYWIFGGLGDFPFYFLIS